MPILTVEAIIKKAYKKMYNYFVNRHTEEDVHRSNKIAEFWRTLVFLNRVVSEAKIRWSGYANLWLLASIYC